VLSRIPFDASDVINGPSEKLNKEILHLLVKCLDNTVLKLEFFNNTALKCGLDMGGEEKDRRLYSRNGKSLNNLQSKGRYHIFVGHGKSG
jgi:hypothetical protein